MGFYTIVTEFVEGRRPNRGDKDDFDICWQALKKLHDLNIIHWDPRPPNFIIKTNSQEACVLDFGFSFKVDKEINKKKLKIKKKDKMKMTSDDGFDIIL